MVKKGVILNIRHLNPLGDQQEQVLLSAFEFPTNEIVIIENSVMNSEDELRQIVEQSNKLNFEILIIPRIRGG